MACGVTGSSMGLVAQDAPPPKPTETPATVDRLDQVEKKLDRLLEALERKPDLRFGTAAGTTRLNSSFAPVEPQALPKPPKPPVPPDPSKPFEVEVVTEDISPQGKRTVEIVRQDGVVVLRKDGQVQKLTGPSGISITGAQSLNSRLEALEKKVNSFDARLLKIERKLGEAPPTSDVAPKADTVKGSVREYVEPKAESGSDTVRFYRARPNSDAKSDDAPPK
jgi:hypothetical protein